MNLSKKVLGTALALGTLSSSVFGAGFEKTVMWSAKWAGVAGAAAGAVEGAESLYFNPAGLVDGEDREVSANFSPLFNHVQGAQTQSDESIDSEKEMRPIMGVLGKKKLMTNFRLG